MITEIEPTESKSFTFHPASSESKLAGFNDKETQEYLHKWGLQESMYIKRFAFDQPLPHYEHKAFITQFFNHPDVLKSLKVKCSGDNWGSLGTVKSVEFTPVNTTLVNLEIFDRLETSGIVWSNGNIKKCLDEYHPSGFIVSDLLRQCLLMEDSEYYCTLDEKDRNEFLVHVFRALVLGGKLCQFEDNLEPYLNVTKKLYKDFVTVTKDPHTSELRVASHVFKITDAESTVSPLFPMENPQNFCYLIVDPVRRTVTVWYHAEDVYYQ